MRPEVSEIPESKPEVEIPHIYSEDRDLNIAVMSSLNSSKEANFSESKPEVAQIVNLDYYHDRFLGIPLSNKGTGENNAISVEQYGEDRDLNIAIMASLKSNKEANFIDPSQDKFYYYDDEDDDIKVLDFLPEVNPFRKQKDPAFIESVAEKGQSSNSQTQPDSENITKICCPVPDCKGALEPEDCRPVLPENMFDRWGNALCEALILGSQKFYCPFKDCSVLLIDDGEEVIRESECPNCRRMFCAQSKNNNWRRCPKCRIFVEKIEGCRYMKCRCGTQFCYSCGSTDLNPETHYCYKCVELVSVMAVDLLK
ncbi:RBR-TYPE E3 UBIQUITIN TRANSFERASE [Salix koriyanagi]|uniref:RBR-TYPE E3 UBIQUITIN TRANSFERASE n=1 Tax=Salix koriyanagi TaxID=2511006 RepID=A0A9Q0W2Q1_9ROSI|nr:RBR-TYPE E3 UBIQUITIN TRANSFERASE [Salix koriyanagi]